MLLAQTALNIISFKTLLKNFPKKKLKTKNVESLKGNLTKLLKLKGLYFDWKNDEQTESYTHKKGQDIGFIAQDVEEVIPEVVFTNSEGYKTLHYNKLVTVAIGSIQEQQTRINMMIEKLDFLLKVVE